MHLHGPVAHPKGAPTVIFALALTYHEGATTTTSRQNPMSREGNVSPTTKQRDRGRILPVYNHQTHQHVTDISACPMQAHIPFDPIKVNLKLTINVLR